MTMHAIFTITKLDDSSSTPKRVVLEQQQGHIEAMRNLLHERYMAYLQAGWLRSGPRITTEDKTYVWIDKGDEMLLLMAERK